VCFEASSDVFPSACIPSRKLNPILDYAEFLSTCSLFVILFALILYLFTNCNSTEVNFQELRICVDRIDQ
jgi:hypothetical protein